MATTVPITGLTAPATRMPQGWVAPEIRLAAVTLGSVLPITVDGEVPVRMMAWSSGMAGCSPSPVLETLWSRSDTWAVSRTRMACGVGLVVVRAQIVVPARPLSSRPMKLPDTVRIVWAASPEGPAADSRVIASVRETRPESVPPRAESPGRDSRVRCRWC